MAEPAVLTHYQMLYRNLVTLRDRVKTMEQERAVLGEGLEFFRLEIHRAEQVLEQARQRGEWDSPMLGGGCALGAEKSDGLTPVGNAGEGI